MSAVDAWLGQQGAASAPQNASAADAWLGTSAVQAPAVSPNGVPSAAQAPATAAQPGIFSSGLVGFAKGLGNTASGIEQLLGKGIGAIAPNGSPAQMVSNYLTNDANFVRNDINQGAAPFEAAHPFATGAGNVAGQIVGTAPAMAIGPAYAGLGLAGRLGLGAAQGAAGAAMMPTSDQGFWTNKAEQVGLGGLLGGALPLAAAGGRAIGNSLMNAARPVFQPGQVVNQGLAAAMSPQEAATAAANIRASQQFVQGSAPTTAQAGATPTLVATEKAAFNGVPGFATQFINRTNENNAARMAALSSVARTPADLEAAVRTREAAAQPAYDAARQGMYGVDPDLESLLQRPAIQDALQRGISIASNRGDVGFLQAVQPVPPTFANLPTGATGFNGSPLLQRIMTNPGTPGAGPQVSGDVLHYLKLGLDDLEQSANENTRLGPTERTAIGQARNDYLNWLDQASPDYSHARQAYAANSPAVNSMEAGQFIQNRVQNMGRNLNSANEIPLAAQSYSQALQQALGRQPYGIDPAAQTTLENIGHDLQRSTISNSIRTGGSDTAYNLGAQGWLARQLYGPAFNGATGLGAGTAAAVTALAGHPIAALGVLGGGRRVGQWVGNRLQQQLAGSLMNPDVILPYLDARAAVPAQAVPGALMQGLLNYGRPAAVSGLLGGFNNPANK